MDLRRRSDPFFPRRPAALGSAAVWARDDLEVVPVRVLPVEAASAVVGVDLVGPTVEWIAPEHLQSPTPPLATRRRPQLARHRTVLRPPRRHGLAPRLRLSPLPPP